MQTLAASVMVVRVEEAEMDEMWSFVQSKQNQRWLWHAIDHRTGQVLAYVKRISRGFRTQATATVVSSISTETLLH